MALLIRIIHPATISLPYRDAFMNNPPPSFFKIILRAFFKGAFLLFGFGFAAIVLVSVIGSLSGGQPRSYSALHAEQLTDSNGARLDLGSTSPVILQVDITGVIGSEACTAGMIEEQLFQSREGRFEEDRVKGILLYISSPGGSAFDSAAIHHAIIAYKKKYGVPVYAYADGLCASGGYYAACATDKIYCADYSLIGSIGVISQFLNFSKAMDSLGLASKTLSEGKGKDAMNPMRPWKADEDKNMRTIIAALYEDFLTAVVDGRPALSRSDVTETLGAHVFAAAQAKELGLVDEFEKSRAEALADLAEDIGLEEGTYQVFRLRHKEWFTQLLMNRSPLFTGKIEHEFHIPGDLAGESRSPWGYLYQPGTN
jgi:protease-4